MTALQLLADLRARGFILAVSSTRSLQVAPKHALTQELRARIIEHKTELIELLAHEGQGMQRSPSPTETDFTESSRTITRTMYATTTSTGSDQDGVCNDHAVSETTQPIATQVAEATYATTTSRHPEREAQLRQLDAECWRLTDERDALATELAEAEARIANGEQQIAERRRQGGKVPSSWITLLLQLRERRNALKGQIAEKGTRIAQVDRAFVTKLGEYEKALQGAA